MPSRKIKNRGKLFTLKLFRSIWDDRNIFVQDKISKEAKERSCEAIINHTEDYNPPLVLAKWYPCITDVMHETIIKKSTAHH
jgi:hypothetical protein